MDLLPADQLADVLGRLPPPSLAACRCVSKEWRDFVNSRDTLRLRLLPGKVAGMFLFLNSAPVSEFFARPTAGPAIPRSLEYLPEARHHVGTVNSHCNGVLVFHRCVVANPATRQWTRLPPPPPPAAGPEIDPMLFREHIAFDPTVSRHYEVLLIPVVPPATQPWTRYPTLFIPQTAEWPPPRFSLRVFSSKTWRWEERTFLRQGDIAGTVADMRLLQSNIMEGLGKLHQSVYWGGSLYTSGGGNFFIRISVSGGEYQVIKPPVGIDQLTNYPLLHLGRSMGEVCCALIHDRNRLQTWFLKESSSSGQGQVMEWVLKHQVDFGYELAQCQYSNQTHGPWMVYDEDFTCQVAVQEKFSVHGSSRDSVYHGENYEEEEKEEEEEEEEEEDCQVPLPFEWDSDNDNIINSKDKVNMRCTDAVTFLGFHPSKEAVFLDVSSSRGVVYHFNGPKVQDLGGMQFLEYDFVRECFLYTPCRMELPVP